MHLDGFGLLVEDMPKMIHFYRDVLGLEPTTGPWGQRNVSYKGNTNG